MELRQIAFLVFTATIMVRLISMIWRELMKCKKVFAFIGVMFCITGLISIIVRNFHNDNSLYVDNTYTINCVVYECNPYDNESIKTMFENGEFVQIDGTEPRLQNSIKEDHWEDINTKETISIYWRDDGQVITEITSSNWPLLW